MPTSLSRPSRLALLAALVLGLVTAVAGCDSASKKPATAQSILQAASAVHYQDLTFDLTLVANQGGQTVSGTGTGAITADPQRTHYTLTVTPPSGDATLASTYEVITDVATATTYARTTAKGQTSPWAAQPADLSGNATSTDFSLFVHGDRLGNPTLIGTETVSGTSCYHLSATPKVNSDTPSGSTTDGSTPTAIATDATPQDASATDASASTTVDLWFATGTTRLAKLVLKSVTSDATASLTLVTTGYDTGLTIDLPIANPSATPGASATPSTTPGSVTPPAQPAATPTPRPTTPPTPPSTPLPTPSPTPVPQASLKVSPQSFSLFPCTAVSAKVTVTNTGPAQTSLSWSASTSDPTYSLSPASGSLSGGASTTVTVSNIVASDSVTFSAPGATGSPQTVTINCTP